jgi:hypothetical protein
MNMSLFINSFKILFIFSIENLKLLNNWTFHMVFFSNPLIKDSKKKLQQRQPLINFSLFFKFQLYPLNNMNGLDYTLSFYITKGWSWFPNETLLHDIMRDVMQLSSTTLPNQWSTHLLQHPIVSCHNSSIIFWHLHWHCIHFNWVSILTN